MNRHFLEFWGKALLMAAQGQKQWEDLARWMQGGFAGFPEFTRLFKSAYGLEEAPEDSPDFFALWKKAEQDFRRSFEDYLSLLGMVPREEYDALKRQCADLEEKAKEQEELIKGLKALAEEKGLGLEAATLELQNLVQKQEDQFQKFIQGLSESLKPDQPQD
jgi:BMFP domain-containing protein YqiC